MFGKVLGLGAGVVIVAFGLWLAWRFDREVPLGLLLVGLFILIVHPALDWLTLMIQGLGGRDEDEGGDRED